MIYYHCIDLHPLVARNTGKFDPTSIDYLKTQLFEGSGIAAGLGCELYVFLVDIIEHHAYDKHLAQHFEAFLQIFEELKINFSILLDNTFEQFSTLTVPNSIYANFCAMKSYINSFLIPTQICNEYWNPSSGKALYLPGKINQYERTIPLVKMYEYEFLDKLVWSYHTAPNSTAFIRNNFLSHYSEDQFMNFLRICAKTLDLPLSTSDMQYRGFPFDPNLYRNTAFSIISETPQWFVNSDGTYLHPPNPTEKTFRTIINKHPFVMIGNPLTLSKLEAWGYKTFKEYMLIPHYNEIDDLEERVEASIQNVMHFSNTLKDHEFKIRQDVEHNYKMFISTAVKHLSQLNGLLSDDQPKSHKFSWEVQIGNR